MTNIVGLTDSQKILNSATLSTSDVGLQSIVEAYTLTRGGLSNFNPRTNDPHPVFPTMACVSSDISSAPGDLRILNVRWVGLLESGSERYVGVDPSLIPSQPQVIETLPAPLISTISAGRRRTRLQDGAPIEGSIVSSSNRIFDATVLRLGGTGFVSSNALLQNPPVTASGDWLEFPSIVNVSFISQATAEEEDILNRNYAISITEMPQEIRGVRLPGYPSPYIYETLAKKEFGAVDPAVGFEAVRAVQIYYGVRLRSISIERQGFFNVIYLSFGDLFEFGFLETTLPVG